jgi:hypothetical protein
MSHIQAGQPEAAQSALDQAVALATALGDITTRDTCQVFRALVAA